MKEFPIERVRERFPALNRMDHEQQVIFFDGPGGTQMADHAIESMYRYIRNGMANLHGTFHSSKDTDAMLDEAREAVADLLGCQAKEVAFGANMTTHAFAIARSLAGFINEGDEIVVTELDHRANVDPWITLAKDRGATVTFIKLDPETFTLKLDELDEVITSKTKLVAVGMSSNVTGTMTDVKTVVNRAKEVGAMTVVDAVHGVPHLAIDVEDLGCDILLCSAYKFFGPHVGIAVVREKLFEKLPVYKLQPAPNEIPYKLETGTQNHEGIAGVIGAIRFIEELGYGETRRKRLQSAMLVIEEYENELAAEVENFLLSLPEVKLFRAVSCRRTPTFAFTIEGQNSRDVTAWLADQYNMCVADGDFYASNMAEVLDVYNTGGWVRIGLAPYNSIEEIQQFKQALTAYIEQHCRKAVI
ncbi:cysteine desulfurase-like protein [Mesobacillus subterraneus]|uniref:Cysteine desulfurase-like protein n=1 Tax=Mesobacillus subterraneus TaxID=285983 RepID=A0A427TWM0_9BACI|nr:cysteine desulfurase-like protein [Mesobacillus subterraneus]RSD28878.1 cysteine desulfurase-like protein [Mesobacillus subterraneus]